MTTSPIKRMVVTEKSARLQEEGKYVFMVEPTATKNEIKKALKKLYKVDVLVVRTIAARPRKTRFRNKISMKQGFKKAIATLKEGQKIEQ